MVIIMILILTVMICKGQKKNSLTMKETARLCCNECSTAFGRSPVGIGPEGAICGRFSTASPISKKCHQYFLENTQTVTGCRRSVLYPPPGFK
jgi:hypothetical protein